MKPALPRAVFDCNVLLQGFLTRGPAYECLERVERKGMELLISPAILHEARDVFTRPRLISKYPQLAAERVSMYFSLLVRKSILIEQVPHVFDFARDPKDEPYLDLAIVGHATHLVSRDKDLLELSMEHNAEGIDLRRLCPELRIVEPQVLLQLLDRSNDLRPD